MLPRFTKERLERYDIAPPVPGNTTSSGARTVALISSSACVSVARGIFVNTVARSLPSGNAGSSKGWHASVNINQRLLLTPAGAANRYGIQTGKIWSAFGSGQLVACCPGAQSGSKFWLRCIGGIPPPSPAVNGGILFGFGAHITPTFAAHVVFCTKFRKHILTSLYRRRSWVRGRSRGRLNPLELVPMIKGLAEWQYTMRTGCP
jgi:hypothetical protein